MLCRAARLPAAEAHLQPCLHTVAKDTYLTSINTGSESKRWTRRTFQTWEHTKTSVTRRTVSSGLGGPWRRKKRRQPAFGVCEYPRKGAL
jgi:hypothetical protein